jgi:hypothetical protein
VTLPPVVSDPEVCWARPTHGQVPGLPHDWEDAWKGPGPGGEVVVCRYCGGRKPDG